MNPSDFTIVPVLKRNALRFHDIATISSQVIVGVVVDTLHTKFRLFPCFITKKASVNLNQL